jgi:hypothetical protein
MQQMAKESWDQDMNNADIPVLKVMRITLDESEEIVFLEALESYAQALEHEPKTLERHFKFKALESLLLKISEQLYGK